MLISDWLRTLRRQESSITSRRLSRRRAQPKHAWVGLESLETRVMLSATIYNDENDKENQGTVGTVQDPFQVGGVPNPFGIGLDITGGPVGRSGAVAIDGGDRDDHGFATPGPDGIIGTSDDVNEAGWLFIEQLVDFGMRGNLNNAPNDILAVGASGFTLEAINSAAVVLGFNVDFVTGAQLQSVNFNNYKLLYVPSDASNVFGGISDADLAILEARKVDVQNFVNSGGSIVALTEAGAANPYGWLELPDPFVINSFGGGGIAEDLRKTQAAIDAGFTITDQELSNGVPYHNEFIGPPGFNGLQPFVLDASNRIITLGLASGSFGIGVTGNDDHGQSVNQGTSTPINSTQTGEITFDGDADFFRVHLRAGVTYVFETRLGTIGDTTLVLYGPDGKTILAFDDDSGLGRASKIVFTPQTSGTYYLNIRPYNYQDRGTYSLIVKEAQDGPIAVPSLVGPLTTTTDDTPTFNWNAVAGASAYELRVNNLTTGQQSLILEVVTGTSFTSAVPLTQGDSYEWKVRAITPHGTVGQFSLPKYFNVQGGLDDHSDVPSDATDIVPGVWQGNMEFIGDEDWFRIVTVPGTTYRVTTTGGVGATLFDDTVAGISDLVGSTLLDPIDGELVNNVVDGFVDTAILAADGIIEITNGDSLSVGTIIQIGTELLEVTGGIGDIVSVTRGFGGTVAADHAVGAAAIVRSIRVTDPAGFPAAPSFTVRVDNEQMLVTAIGAGINADRFIVTRATNGTIRANHQIGADVVRTASTVTFSVLNTGSFPAAPGFVVQIDNERFQVTSIVGNVFTATRAFHNTTRAIHGAGSFVSLQLFGGSSVLQFTATDEGPYFIQIKHPTGQTGAYTMNVSGLAGDTHGDNFGTAFPINLNETIDAKIETHRDEDWFVFTAPHDGHFMFETLLSTLTDSFIELYDSDGTTLLSSDDDSGVGRASKIERDMLTGQTVYVRVLGRDGYTGSYSVMVTERQADDHLNNSLLPASLTQLLLNNPVFGNGNIEMGGDQDWFKIDAVAGQAFVLETVAGTLNDTTLTLFDSDGTTQLAFDDDGGPGKLSRIVFTPSHSGTYFVRVKAFSAVATGTYQVTYSAAGQDDYGNNAAAAALILPNTVTPGSIETAGDQDWFKFDAVAGQDYVIETLLISNPDTVLTLYDTDGTTVIATNDDGGIGKASRITWQPSVNGTYFIKVTSYGSQQTGTYKLSLTEVADDHGDSADDPTAILVNSSTPGNLELQLDQDWFTVDLFQNTFYRFEIETGTLPAARFTLVDQDGKTVIETTETTTGILLGKNFIEFLAPGTGTYFLKVQSLGSTQTGTYVVNVIEPLVSGVGTPNLLMPKGIITDTRFPTFTWTAASQAERYVLRVDDLTTGQTKVIYETNLTTTTFTPTTALMNGHVYRWTVQAFNDTSGKAGLPSLGQNFVLELVDDHADSAIGATLIPINTAVSGDLEFPGDQDWFRFKAIEGADYIIEVALGTLTDSTLELVDKNGTTVIDFDDNGGPGLGSRILFHANSTGTYFLRVKPITSNLIGTYSVSVIESIDDHGNFAAEATFVQAPSVTGGNIEIPGDQDWFRVLTVNGVTYDFSTILGSIPGTALTLYAGDGVTVINEDLSGGTSTLSYTATKTGSVFLAVRGFAANQTGTYTFRVTSSADDHGNNALASTPISVNSITQGNIETFGDQDWFRISLAASQDYVFETSLLTLPNTTLTLYDVNGISVLDMDDDSGQGLASRIEFTPTADGVYYLKVQAFNSSQLGTYTIRAFQDITLNMTVGPNINLSQSFGNEAQGAIAINPLDPNNIFAVSNTDYANALFGALSTDGGATFTTRLLATGSDGLIDASGDASVAFDEFGNLFIAYLDNNFGPGGEPRVIVGLSTNGGTSFTQIATLGVGDQPTIVTTQGAVWLTFTRNNAIHVSSAAVTGLGQVGVFSPATAVPGSANGSFGDIAIGPNGEVMVAYQENFGDEGPADIFINIDPDGLGPQPFGNAIFVGSTNVGSRDFLPSQNNRAVDAEISLAWDRSGGVNNGRIYMVYTDESVNENNNFDVILRFSDNFGATWSPPVRVNDDSTSRSQFLPKLSIDQTTGNIAIAWHDARNDNGTGGTGDTNGIPNDDVQLWGTVSLDGGISFLPNVQISTGTSNADDAQNSIDFGDYMGISFHDGLFRVVWADNSNSTGDNPDGSLGAFDLYTAQVNVTQTVAPPTAFELHSNPGASKVIYLDFTGHTTSGTQWNLDFNGGADFTTPAYDIDGDTTTFSDEEINRIRMIWARVAEDFMPFDVDVTTEDPGVDALINSGGLDSQWGIRVVIGGSAFDWLGFGAGGIAYIGSFSDPIDTPTYVFTAQLANGDEKFTAEASSHEVGHTLGLLHDGRTNPSEEYYAGTLTWAPIMGVAYDSNLSQWSRGEYANASNLQDDLTIITSFNGFGYRADDYGNTPGTAANLTSGIIVDVTGIISQTSDVDVFTFTTNGGAINLSIDPAPLGPNLDILAELLDSNGNVVVSSNPTGSLNASINTTVAAGTYYVRIDGVGEGDPTGTGYSDYASLGAYTITGTVAAIPPVNSPVASGSPAINGSSNNNPAASVQYIYQNYGWFTGAVSNKLIGTTSSVNVVPYEPVTVNGGTIEVNGSDKNDEITLVLGTQYTIVVNGTEYHFDPAGVQRIELLGKSGQDVLHVTGTAGNDDVTLRPGTLELKATGIVVVADSFSSIDVQTGGGSDRAFLYDSVGNDVYTATPTTAKLEGAGYSNRVDGFRRVYAYSYAGGFDTAKLHDSAGNDNFIGEAARSWMTGNGYYNSATRFDQVDAYTSTGYDVAMMWDSEGNDLYQVNPTMSSLSGSSFNNRAHGFDRSYGYSYNGGTDVARVYDSSGDDRLIAKEARTTINGDYYYASATRFEEIYAFAIAGGEDRADIYGTSANDHLESGPNKSTLYSSSTTANISKKFEVSNFERVNVHSGGGNDTATIVDSSGNDYYVNAGDTTYVTWANNNRVYTNFFKSVDVKALYGGNDTAEFRALNAIDQVFGNRDLAIVTRDTGRSSKVTGFDRVIAQSLTSSGPATDLSSLDYVFSKAGLWS